MKSNSIQGWIEKASDDSSKRRSLYSLVFGHGSLSYFFYRTQLQLFNTITRLSLHILEYFLIFHTMPHFLMAMIFIRLFIIAFDSGWWGLLDSMRQRIRNLRDKNDNQSILQEIESWLFLAKKVAAIVLFIGILASIFLAGSLNQSILIFVLSLQLATRIILRTLHSGAYAIQRVYIKFEWVILSDLIVFAIAWSMKPVLGEWTLTLCILVSFLLSSAINYYFVRSALEFMKISPALFIPGMDSKQISKDHKIKNLLMPCVAMSVLRFHDLILILAMFFAYTQAITGKDTMIAFYLMTPAIKTAMNWAQVMHFDMIRGQVDAFKGLRKFFNRIGYIYSLIYGAMIGLMAFVLLEALKIGTHHDNYLIAIYIIMLSMLGFAQINTYSYRNYFLLIVANLIQYFFIFILIYFQYSLELVFLVSTIVPLSLLLFLQSNAPQPSNESEYRFLNWVQILLNSKKTTSILVIEFGPDTSLTVKRTVADNLFKLEHFDKNILHTYYKDYLFCLLPNKEFVDEKERSLIIESGAGHIKSIDIIHGMSADDAKLKLYKKCRIKLEIAESQRQEIMDRFLSIFPHGFVQIPTRKNDKFKNVLSVRDIFFIAADALAFAEGKRRYGDSKWFTTSVHDNGYISVLFTVNKDLCSDSHRRQWVEDIHSFSR